MAEAGVGDLKVFGVDAGFGRDGHEIGIAEPAGEGVKMQVAGYTGSCGAAEVHAEIHAVGLVILLEGFFHALGESHHFVEGGGIAEIEFGDVGVGDDHDVAGGIRKTIKNDEDFCAAIGDERLGIVVARDGVAEDAVRLLAGCDLRHVLVAPRSPEIVHREASSGESCADRIAQNEGRFVRDENAGR